MNSSADECDYKELRLVGIRPTTIDDLRFAVAMETIINDSPEVRRVISERLSEKLSEFIDDSLRRLSVGRGYFTSELSPRR